MATKYVYDLAHVALTVERQVDEHLTKAFNLDTLGVIDEKGASLEALQVIAHLNQAMGIILSFENAVLNRCNGT